MNSSKNNSNQLTKKPTQRQSGDSGRPEIELTLDEMRVNNQVIDALGKQGGIYDHNGHLAIIKDEHADGEARRKTIHHLCPAALRELISETCKFFVWRKNRTTGKNVQIYQRVPRWCYDGVLARGSWPGIAPIRGIVSSPVLRADGSILQEAGYDSDSALYVDLSEKFNPIPSAPTADDVQVAVALLVDLVSDFPFANEAARSGWLASLLTPLAREAYYGCTGPLFLIDANTRGSGKGLLADVSSLIVMGRTATRMTAPKDDEWTSPKKAGARKVW